jgi:hypothetical protein
VKEPLPTSFGEDLYYRLGGWLEGQNPTRRWRGTCPRRRPRCG